MAAKGQTSIRLTEETKAILDRMVEEWGATAGIVIDVAIRQLKRLMDEPRNPKGLVEDVKTAVQAQAAETPSKQIKPGAGTRKARAKPAPEKAAEKATAQKAEGELTPQKKATARAKKAKEES